MIGTKYLSEAVDINNLEKEKLNIIKAPTGSGKTYFALHEISSLCQNTVAIFLLLDVHLIFFFVPVIFRLYVFPLKTETLVLLILTAAFAVTGNANVIIRHTSINNIPTLFRCFISPLPF